MDYLYDPPEQPQDLPYDVGLFFRGWITFAGALAVFIIGFIGEELHWQPCTVDDPCLPQPIGMTSAGLLIATAFAAFLDARAARWLATAFVAVFAVASIVELTHVWWVHLGAAVFEGLLCWLVLWPRDGVRRLRRDEVLALKTFSVCLALIAAGTTVAWAVNQRAAVEREAAADVVEAEVVAHEEYHIVVSVDGITVLHVYVLNPPDYPVGSTVLLLVDADGLAQPVSEPHDADLWLVAAGATGGLAFAFWLRAMDIPPRPKRGRPPRLHHSRR